MTDQEARDLLIQVLGRIAPEIDGASLDPDAQLGDDLDLDSMDFLSLVEGAAVAARVDNPQRDNPQLTTRATFAAYLAQAAPV
jgi:hypothetical protein